MCFLFVNSHHDFLLAVHLDVPSGNTVTPPKLARNTPVLNILQPLAVGVLVLIRIELDFVVHDGRQCNIGKMLHLEEPLQREARLNSRVGIALRIPHLVGVVLHLFHKACCLEVFGNLLAAGKAVHANIERRLLGNGAIVVENVDGLQVVSLAEIVVIDIVGRGHLQTACTKLNIDIAVLDNLHLTTHEGHNDMMSAEPLVLGVFGVDAHGRVTHDGLGTRGGNHSIVTLFVAVDDIAFGFQNFLILQCFQPNHIVFKVIQF